MIKGLLGMCGIKVSAGDTSVPYIYPNTTNPMTGMVRPGVTGIIRLGTT